MNKIRPCGGYRNSCSFQTATIIYDATVWFCERFLADKGRMTDQMVQAARSGRQNIAEGSRAAGASETAKRRGQVPIRSEDCANRYQTPAVSW